MTRLAALAAMLAILAAPVSGQGIESSPLPPPEPEPRQEAGADRTGNRRVDEGRENRRIDGSLENRRRDGSLDNRLRDGVGEAAGEEGLLDDRREEGGFFERAPEAGNNEVREATRGFKQAPPSPNLPDVPERITLAPADRQPGAVLRALDKMTGATRRLEVEAGSEVEMDRLLIRLEACLTPGDGGTTGPRAFLQIRDRRDGAGVLAFSGWMFADSPALSALDHPRYDVWVISCTTSEGSVSSGSE